MLERSVLLLQAESKKEAYKVIREDSMLRDVYENIEFLGKDGEIIGLYDAEEEREALIQKNIAYAEQRGISKGISKGLKDGIKQEKIEIARNLLKEKVNFNVIMTATGLSLETLEQLEKRNK